jgi:hypothetical protein
MLSMGVMLSVYRHMVKAYAYIDNHRLAIILQSVGDPLLAGVTHSHLVLCLNQSSRRFVASRRAEGPVDEVDCECGHMGYAPGTFTPGNHA